MGVILLRSIENRTTLEMIYMANNGEISQRRIKVLEVNQDSIRAYCYLRKSKRTFKVNNILALIPVTQKERMGA